MSNYYTYSQVSPRNMRWDNIEFLSLFQISIEATDLIVLVFDAMPALEHLEMGEIFLSRGSWDCVLEALKQMHRFRPFHIPNDDRLDQYESREFYQLDSQGFYRLKRQRLHTDDDKRLYGKLDTYVVHGGRHPLLRSEQPNSAAKEYTRDLEQRLRERLIDLYSSSSEVESSTLCSSVCLGTTSAT